MILTCVSKSKNTGFDLNIADYQAGFKAGTFKRTLDISKVLNPGTAPVVVERVGYTLKVPGKPVKWRAIDFALKEIAAGGPSNILEIPEDLPVFCVELTR